MRITGGQIFDLEHGFSARDLYTDGALISGASGDGAILNADGCYVIPGLVDVHFHGCVGEDFSDATPDGLQKIADFELSQGVTYICPAGMTLPEDQLTAICKNTAAHRAKNSGGAEVVGAHLEGPFLCMAKKGAQNGDYLHDPDAAMLQRLQEAAEGCVRLVTLAPEQPGSVEFIKAAKELGIHVSVGHTVANYDTAKAAFEAGADHATHLYNGMPSFLHRAPGIIGAAFDAEASVELICDGLHVHPSVIRAVSRLFGDKLNLISDSLRCAGKTSPAVYELTAEKFGARVSECAVVEDAAFALKTAKEAGFFTIGVYDPSETDQEMARRYSDRYVQGLRELISESPVT